MNKKVYIVLLSILISLFVISSILNFGGAAICFLAAIIELIECYYALNPDGTKKIWSKNTLKMWFVRKNKLQSYQRLSFCLFCFFFALAFYSFVLEVLPIE